MLKKYRLEFDIWGLLLFLVIMIPNFIWFNIPAPNDILRAHSITKIIDAAASASQIALIAALCILKNNKARSFCITPFIISAAGCCLLYAASWIAYYGGIVNAIVILGLTIPPCLAFLFFAIDRKNGIALIPISVFTICHLIFASVNFIM